MVRSWLKKLKKKRSFKSSDFSATSGEESALEDDNSADQSPYFTSKRNHKAASNSEHAQSPYSNVINLKDHFKKFTSDAEDEYSEDDRTYDSTDDCSSRSDTLPSISKKTNHKCPDELENLIKESGRLLRESEDMDMERNSLENVELFDDDMLLAFQDGQLSFQDFLVSPKHESELSVNNNFSLERKKDEEGSDVGSLTGRVVTVEVDGSGDDGDETERYESGDDSSLDEYSGVKGKVDMAASNGPIHPAPAVYNKDVSSSLCAVGPERTNCAGTPYPELMIPNESSKRDNLAASYQELPPDAALQEQDGGLMPVSNLMPGASLEKLAQEMFSNDSMKFALNTNLFGSDDDYHLSISQQDINSNGKDSRENKSEDIEKSKSSIISPSTPDPRNKLSNDSDNEDSDESEHTIVNTVSAKKIEPDKRQTLTDRKALKSMPNFPGKADVLGTSAKDKPSEGVDLRSRSADSAARHSCNSPSVAQREICIVEDKIISAPGSYTRLLSNDDGYDNEVPQDIKLTKTRANTDPWLTYLPSWKQQGKHSNQASSGRNSRGYSNHSSYLNEGNATDSEISTLSGRVSISSEYSTTSGAETSSADERSLKSGLEIDFYLPPPPPLDEDYMESDREFLLDASPFNLDWDYEQSDSPTLTPSSSVIFLGRRGRSSEMSGSTDDPISESLLAMLPIPEDNFQPVMSQAVGEIITEIISSRQKFGRLLRQLDTHEKLLREHGQQIQKQARELEELRKPRDGRLHERAVRTGGHERIKKRAASVNKLANRCSSRRSRELTDLSCTLDRLLFQCYTLQKNSKAEKETHLYQPLTGAGRRNGRRKTPCEDRIKTKKVKALLLRRAPVVPVYYSQVIPAAKAILKTFNLVSEGIRKPDWI